jgi:ATP-dependent DNA helicase PIF1
MSQSQNQSQLTDCQERCFNAFKKGMSLVMTGPAGCGKSFLICQMNKYALEQNKTIAVTALTGAAAALVSGLTLHKWGGIGLATGSSEEIYQNMRKYGKTGPWRDLDILIIDEISMMGAELFNKLNKIAQLIRRNGLFFGGIQVVLCGDFCQLKPVSETNAVKFCFESSEWQKHLASETYYLDKVMRQTDPVFQDLLSSIRVGNITPEQRAILDERIITDDHEADLIVEMSDGTRQTIIATTLYPKKMDVDRTNKLELNRLIASGSQPVVFKSIDNAVTKNPSTTVPAKPSQIEVLEKCCSALPEITLAIGAQVMLVKNLDMKRGLVNGSRGIVVEFVNGIPEVMFDNGESVAINYEPFNVESGKITLVRMQIPLILAWALTIHKCQGATITNVITDLTGVFEEAQVYVTLSRVRSLDGLFIRGINYSKIKCNPKVKAYYEGFS